MANPMRTESVRGTECSLSDVVASCVTWRYCEPAAAGRRSLLGLLFKTTSNRLRLFTCRVGGYPQSTGPSIPATDRIGRNRDPDYGAMHPGYGAMRRSFEAIGVAMHVAPTGQ